jgi:hypothetical protein
MSNVRISRWMATGACIGVLFAVLALTDARHLFPYTLMPSDRVDFYLCWWMVLEFASWNVPHVLTYTLIIFLNASTYALLFLIIGTIARLIQRFGTAPIIRGEQ